MNDWTDEPGDDMPTAPFWMVTFSDMVTLLLTFFVMIVAMSEVEVKKFEEALSYFQGSTGLLMQEGGPPDVATGEQFKSREQAAHYEELLDHLKADNLEDDVQVELTDRGIHIIITDSVMFRSGEAVLIEPSRTILKLLSTLIDETVASVVVEGHTDDRPIHTARYPSNWELSAARAASTVRFLHAQTDALAPSQYVVIGYGPYRPVATNETSEGRAQNRRVEILLSWTPWNYEKASFLKTTPN